MKDFRQYLVESTTYDYYNSTLKQLLSNTRFVVDGTIDYKALNDAFIEKNAKSVTGKVGKMFYDRLQGMLESTWYNQSNMAMLATKYLPDGENIRLENVPVVMNDAKYTTVSSDWTMYHLKGGNDSVNVEVICKCNEMYWVHKHLSPSDAQNGSGDFSITIRYTWTNERGVAKKETISSDYSKFALEFNQDDKITSGLNGQGALEEKLKKSAEKIGLMKSKSAQSALRSKEKEENKDDVVALSKVKERFSARATVADKIVYEKLEPFKKILLSAYVDYYEGLNNEYESLKKQMAFPKTFETYKRRGWTYTTFKSPEEQLINEVGLEDFSIATGMTPQKTNVSNDSEYNYLHDCVNYYVATMQKDKNALQHYDRQNQIYKDEKQIHPITKDEFKKFCELTRKACYIFIGESKRKSTILKKSELKAEEQVVLAIDTVKQSGGNIYNVDAININTLGEINGFFTCGMNPNQTKIIHLLSRIVARHSIYKCPHVRTNTNEVKEIPSKYM